MINITKLLVQELYQLSHEKVEPALLHQAKRCLLDYLGSTLAGAGMLQEKERQLLDLYMDKDANVPVVGMARKAALQSAALINGMNAHAIELDDGERYAMMHPGAPVLSSLLPIAAQREIDGTTLLKGVITGYEAALRIAGALQPTLKDRGYHATGACGALGAAIGVASILNFSQDQMRHALSAAATSASGILKVIRDGSELKPYNAGQAALNGLNSALLAGAGFQGPDDVLGGEDGFLAMMGNTDNPELVLSRRNDRLAIERIYVKPYAACRHCHAPIEAVLQLRAENGLRVEDVEDIHVTTYTWALHLHDHTDIQGITSAKMSVPYSVAVALESGKAGMAEFSRERLSATATLALTKKVRVRADDVLTKLVPDRRVAIVDINTRQGQRHTARVDLPKGEPENPVNDMELTDKFIDLATYAGKSQAEAERIVDQVWKIEDNRSWAW